MYGSRPRNDPHFSSCRPQNHSQLILGIEWHPRTMDQAKRFHYATRSNSQFNGSLINLNRIFQSFTAKWTFLRPTVQFFLAKNYLLSSHYENQECDHCFFLFLSFLPPRSFFFSFPFPSLL